MDLNTSGVSEMSGITPPLETSAPIKHSNGRKSKQKTPTKKINAKCQRKKISPKRKNEIQEMFERIKRKKEERKLAIENKEDKKIIIEERKFVENVRRKFEENSINEELEVKKIEVTDEERITLDVKKDEENYKGKVEKIRMEYEKKIINEEKRKLYTKHSIKSKKKEKESNVLKPEAVKNSPIQRRKLKLGIERKLSQSIKKVKVELQDGKKIANDSNDSIWDLWGLSRIKRT